jgi:hypothetical protein
MDITKKEKVNKKLTNSENNTIIEFEQNKKIGENDEQKKE